MGPRGPGANKIGFFDGFNRFYGAGTMKIGWGTKKKYGLFSDPDHDSGDFFENSLKKHIF